MKKIILIITLVLTLFTFTCVKAQGGKDFESFITHIVQPKETVYGISHKYNVSKEYLVSLNTHLPRLKDNFLEINNIIKIRPLEKNTVTNVVKKDSVSTQKNIVIATKIEEVKDYIAAEPLVINWVSSFKKALKKGEKEKKPILVYFTGSDWCRPCKKVSDELFNTEDFKKFSDEKIVLYKADFPHNKDLVSRKKATVNEKLSNRYNRESYPTMVIINYKGEVLGRRDGYYMIDFYSDFIKQTVKNNK